MVLKIDGQKVNLLSLKTDTETLGQYSGLEFDNVKKFFGIGLGIDITPYQGLLSSTLDKQTLVKNLFKIYDEVIAPEVTAIMQNHQPDAEAGIVRRLAKGAMIFARGEALEEVDIVKLDDKIKDGNYKVMRYTESLYDAMKLLDLEVEYTRGTQNRTLKILVKPSGTKERGSNLLCKFRSQVMGG